MLYASLEYYNATSWAELGGENWQGNYGQLSTTAKFDALNDRIIVNFLDGRFRFLMKDRRPLEARPPQLEKREGELNRRRRDSEE